MSCLNRAGEIQNVFATDEDMTVSVECKVFKPGKIDIYVGVLRMDYMLCYCTRFHEECDSYMNIERDGIINIKFPGIKLLPSKYMLDIRIIDSDGNDVDVYNEAAWFQIYSPSKEAGMFRMQHEWIIE